MDMYSNDVSNKSYIYIETAVVMVCQANIISDGVGLVADVQFEWLHKGRNNSYVKVSDGYDLYLARGSLVQSSLNISNLMVGLYEYMCRIHLADSFMSYNKTFQFEFLGKLLFKFWYMFIKMRLAISS